MERWIGLLGITLFLVLGCHKLTYHLSRLADQGKADQERGALSLLALEPYFSTLAADNFFDQAQTNTQPAEMVGIAGDGRGIFFEDTRAVPGIDHHS